MPPPGPGTPAPDGVLVLDKPAGLTSHDVVARVRRLAGTRKVGHAGTLDPMATGVLVLGVGRATRLLTFLVGADKEYLATIRLGVATSTDDAEGEVTAVTDASAVSADRLAGPMAALRGDLQQVPSSVSAIKVDGRRAYARVRAGEQVVLPARPVTVSRFELLAQRRDVEAGTVDLDVLVGCSSGTYVRALARDLGAALGVGGHLTALRRTRVGPYDLAAARTLEQLGERFAVLPMAQAAGAAFPVWTLDQDSASRLLHGQRLRATAETGYPQPRPAEPPAPTGPPGDGPGGPDLAGQPVAALAPDGTLIAVVVRAGDLAKPLVVLAG